MKTRKLLSKYSAKCTTYAHKLCFQGWDQVVAFITLTMHHKMELAGERQRWPTAAATQHPIPDLVPPTPVFAVSNPATDEEDDPGWSTTSTMSSDDSQ